MMDYPLIETLTLGDKEQYGIEQHTLSTAMALVWKMAYGHQQFYL